MRLKVKTDNFEFDGGLVGMLIRKATMDDIEALRELYLELEQDAVKYQPEHFVIGYRDDEFFEKIFNSENQDILVVETESKVVGFSHVMIIKQCGMLKATNSSIYSGFRCNNRNA